MALTKNEKEILDLFMLANIDNINKKSPWEISCYVNGNIHLNCSYQSIYPSIERISSRLKEQGYYCVTSYSGKYFKVYFEKADYIFSTNCYGISKEKNILSFEGCPELKYDFITKTFNLNLDDIANVKKVITDNILDMLKYEWLFNYVNDLKTIHNINRIFSKNEYEKMPKGLLDTINNNGGLLTAEILKEHLLKLEFGKYYKMVSTLYARYDRNQVNCFLKDYTPAFFEKLIKNSILNGYLNIDDEMYYLFRNYYKAIKMDIKPILDDNRDIDYNCENIENLINREKNAKLEEKLRKLNFINGLEIENYVVVVPQTQKDKQDEGKMQNNCVGHYYDDSILQGRNYIYFLRKKENPNKSYITCRFAKDYGKTAEARKHNNNDINNNHEIELINEIDKIILQHLSEL